MFEKLVTLNCYSNHSILKKAAGNLLEKFYCCEINCTEINKTVQFAHHARGCIIIASKICENVVIFQNVTIGSNMQYNKLTNEWENIGNPIICKNVVVADGAKILGPVTIGENSVVAAGAIITKDIPPNSIAYSVNQCRPKNMDYDFLFNANRLNPEKIITANHILIAKFNEHHASKNL